MSTASTPQEAEWFAAAFERIQQNVETFIRGKSGVVRLALICLTSEGHLLIDDIPGVGKTSMAKAIAASVHGSASRIQFTPDLLPTDVTGVQIYNSGTGGFEFHEGPIFANVVIADEINRASPKTQSSLLEVMEERQVTVDGITFRSPRPFIVMATQNPVEMDGTYNLPEAQIDRFMMRTGVGYPDHDSEVEVLISLTTGGSVSNVQAVVTIEDVARMIDIARRLTISRSIHDYVVSLTSATRKLDDVRLGVSPRGSIALVHAAQAYAASQGRPMVVTDDVKALAPYVLGHRMLLTADAELQGKSSAVLISQILDGMPVPHEYAVR